MCYDGFGGLLSTNNANKRRKAGLNLSVVAYSDSRAVPVDKTLTLAFALENISAYFDTLFQSIELIDLYHTGGQISFL